MTLEQRIVLLAQAMGTDVKTLRTSIGVLANLTGTVKTDIVAALNESIGKVTTNTNAIGTLANLTTTAKGNLVAALNEIHASLSLIDLTSIIDDLAASSVTNKTYSASKITNLIAGAVSDLVASSPATLDTLNELAAALGNDPSFATTISTALGNRVRVDAAQTFTAPEQTQARSNIGAASITAASDAQTAADGAQGDIDALVLAVGNTDHDFTVEYAAAKL